MKETPNAKDFFTRAAWSPNKPDGKLVVEGVAYLPSGNEKLEYGMMIPGENPTTKNTRLSILFAAIPVTGDALGKYQFSSETFGEYVKNEFNNKVLELDIYFDLNATGENMKKLKQEFEVYINESQEVPRTKTKVVLGGGG
ncbi:MAG: hypothetical protein ACPG5P_06515 [Saprospiraceae bacterium]